MKQLFSAWHCAPMCVTILPWKDPEIHYWISQKPCLHLSIVQFFQSHSLVLQWFLSVRYDCAAILCGWDQKDTGLLEVERNYRKDKLMIYTRAPQLKLPTACVSQSWALQCEMAQLYRRSCRDEGSVTLCVFNETPWYCGSVCPLDCENMYMPAGGLCNPT